MIWFLVIGGLLLIVLGVWGGPQQFRRPDKASRIHKEATVQEAWDILTSPVDYEEEAIKIPEHKPWYLPGRDRRFHQGLALGLGVGLVAAAVLSPFVPTAKAPWERSAAKQPPAAATPPAATAKPAPATTPPAAGQKPAETKPPAAATPAPAPAPAPKPKPANVTFTVEPGSSSDVIAANLKAAGLIASEQEFLDLVVAYGADTKLKAGTFVIPTGATLDTVIQKLTE